jgi:benzoate/toluate 1,2-dioxygenase beta subunit
MSPAGPPNAALEAFVLHEARLLDERRFDDWVDLFLPEGEYWVPMSWDQTDPLNQVSIIYETASILRIRMKRLVHEATASQFPVSRTVHHLTNLSQPAEDVVEGALLFMEHRRSEQRSFSGLVRWDLKETAQGLRIRRKTVRLINCDQDTGHLRLGVPF